MYDEQPLTLRQSWRQRIRWVQGGLQVSIRYAGDLLRGLFTGGRTSWASFETATLSLWGYLLGAAAMGMTMLTAFFDFGTRGLILAVLAALGGTAGWMLVLGALTMISEWKNIRAPWSRKLLAVVTFPLFMLTFIPVGVCALFCRRGWAPVHHTVAVPIGAMQARE